MMRYALGLAVLLTGCVVGPDYHKPDVATPKQWSSIGWAEVRSPSIAKDGLPSSAHPMVLEKWWQNFNDPILNQLIVDAINANLDLKQTLDRIKDARAQRTEAIASGLPSFSGTSNVNRRLNSSASTSSTSQAGGVGFGSQVINLLQFGISAQWELDFFGGVQRAIEVADATIGSEIEHRHDVIVILLGEVARNYIELRGNQQLIVITEANLCNQQDTLNLLNVRQQAGLADMMEVSQAQAQLATTEAQLPSYETAVQQAIHALSLLLAKQPDALAARLAPVATIPMVKTTVMPDLPSELLQRRPDIRYAERQLAAANAQIGIAESELYPKFNLAEFIGLQNTRITDFTPIGKSWSVGTTLTAPLFNWGKLNANIKSKEAQYQQSLLGYQKTILTAFKEVEDALVSYRKEQQKHQSLQQAVTANQQAVQLATMRYEKGLTNFINVLESQQALYQAQSALVSSSAKTSADVVLLYKVLGGGWQTF
jgi:NodT family efflux transporter outer membrane factor (OMF) lipoprotein